MTRIKKDENEENVGISTEMLKAIKNDFPIDLFNVQAQRKDRQTGNIIVMQYKNDVMQKYINAHIKKYEKTIADAFIFEKYSTIWSSDEKGNKKKTDYFCPRSFWDNVFKKISKMDDL